MSTLYVANKSQRNLELYYCGTSGPTFLKVPPNSVAELVDTLSKITSIVAQWAPYGIGDWSGSGIGYQIDTPITL